MTTQPHALTWEKVMLRMRSAARTTTGACIVTLRVVTVEGKPEFIMQPIVDRIEPRSDADRFVNMLAGSGFDASTGPPTDP